MRNLKEALAAVTAVPSTSIQAAWDSYAFNGTSEFEDLVRVARRTFEAPEAAQEPEIVRVELSADADVAAFIAANSPKWG